MGRLSLPGRRRLARLSAHVAPAAAEEEAGTAAKQAALATLLDEARAAEAPALTWRDVFRAEPPYRPGPLSPAQCSQYWRDGYAVVPVPADVDMDALRAAIADLVELNARDLVKKGRLTEEQHAATVDVEFERRQALIEDYVPGCSFELFSRSCNGPSSKLARSAAVRQLQSSPGMLEIVAQLTGAPDIDLTGAFSMRCKCPNHNMTDQVGASGGEWHQDLAYGIPDGEETIAITGWLPLQETSAEMGTINVIAGGHRAAYLQAAGGTLPHHVGWGNEMKVDGVSNPTAFMQLDEDPEGVLGEAVAVHVPEDHFVLLSNVIPHKGGANETDVMRARPQPSLPLLRPEPEPEPAPELLHSDPL